MSKSGDDIPTLREPSAPPFNDPEQDSDGGKPEPCTKTVLLIVDDEPALRRVMWEILTEAGYSILTAIDGRSAIDAVETFLQPIALAIIDYNLPRMAGPTLAMELQELKPGIRVLFVSGYPAFASDHPFLQKPFHPAELISKVKEVLES
jgi:DNA-binding response OmpR family regulator